MDVRQKGHGFTYLNATISRGFIQNKELKFKI